MIEIIPATSEEDFEVTRRLFLEYAESLDFDLGFQSFGHELATLEEEYASPQGCILLAKDSDNIVGCVALRPFEAAICEMKRLYVVPAYQGQGIGRLLAREVIAQSRKAGYKKMRLDTIATMQAARTLYESLGFYRIEPYRYNPIEGTTYMELDLEMVS
ncbi:MAG: GNAT family N-acetyltransferase [Desulfobacterales bacterium]|jgi:ribosomal protein S18 acetylase RimI-like enzyme